MSLFKTTPPPPPPTPPRELLVEKLDSLRPGALEEEPRVVLRDDEVTGLLDLTFERMEAAQSASTEQLRAATERLLSPPPTPPATPPPIPPRDGDE
jgi:hypothetical protein